MTGGAGGTNAKLSGGFVRFGRWVPFEKNCLREGALKKTAALSVTALPPTAPRMLRAYNASLDHAIEQATRLSYQDWRHKRAAEECGGSGASGAGKMLSASADQSEHSSRPLRCDMHSALGKAGIRLLIGVHTSPLTQVRRDAIRKTWARGYSATSNSTLACFVVGAGGSRVPPELRRQLEAENRAHGDLLVLPNVEDGHCHITVEKAHAWWAWAAGTSVPHIARVDDDTFVHTPNLMSAVTPLACHRYLVFGVLAYVGYNPSTFRKCGFSWQLKDVNRSKWKRYGCDVNGAHQPFLFPSGMLQVLSLPVARAVAESASVQAFVRRATELIDLSDWDRTEDVALGFWLSQLLAEQPTLWTVPPPLPSIVFVRSTATQAHNLGCQKSDPLYRHPRMGSAAIHYVKKPSGMEYLYNLRELGGREPFVGKACTRATGVG